MKVIYLSLGYNWSNTIPFKYFFLYLFSIQHFGFLCIRMNNKEKGFKIHFYVAYLCVVLFASIRKTYFCLQIRQKWVSTEEEKPKQYFFPSVYLFIIIYRTNTNVRFLFCWILSNWSRRGMEMIKYCVLNRILSFF